MELFDSKTQDVLATTSRDRLALGGDANSLAAGAAVGTMCHIASASVDLGKQATTVCVCVCVGKLENSCLIRPVSVHSNEAASYAVSAFPANVFA